MLVVFSCAGAEESFNVTVPETTASFETTPDTVGFELWGDSEPQPASASARISALSAWPMPFWPVRRVLTIAFILPPGSGAQQPIGQA